MMKEAECTLGTEKVKARCWLPAQAGLRSLDLLFISPFPQCFALRTYGFGGGSRGALRDEGWGWAGLVGFLFLAWGWLLGGQTGLEGWETSHGECSLLPPAVVSSIVSHRRGDGGTDLAAEADRVLPRAGSPEAGHGRSPPWGCGSSRGYGSVVRIRERGIKILKPSQCQRLH